MKNLKSITSLLLAVLVFSCSADSDEISNSNEQFKIETQSVEDPFKIIYENSNNSQSRTGDITPIPFEHGLEWTAFIAGKVLYNTSHISERSYFTANHSSNSYVTTVDLFGPNPVHQGFKDKFIAQLTDYMLNGIQQPIGGCPGGDGEPDEPIFTAGNDGSVQQQVAYFMNWLTNDNCTELYFPVGLDFGFQPDEITTMSHPLTSAVSNEGIQWREELCGTLTEYVTVNNLYVSNGNSNIIMARPVKKPGSINCDYPQYPDFTLFLQGPF